MKSPRSHSNFFGSFLPSPFEGVETVEFQIPMQIVARAFGDEDHFFPHMTVLAGLAAAGLRNCI